MADKAPFDALIGEEPELTPPAGAEIPPPVQTQEPEPKPETPGDGEPPPDEGESPEPQGEPPPDVPEQIESQPELPKKRHDENSPWARYRKEKQRAEDLQRRLEALEAQHSQAQQAEQARLAEIQRVAQGQQQTPEPWQPGTNRPPTEAELAKLHDEDPLLALKIESQMARQAALQAQEQNRQMQLQSQIRDQVETFRRKQPDYDDAMKYLEEGERRRWKAAGASDQNIDQIIQARAGLLINAAMAAGRSVAEVAYETAKADGWAQPAAAATTPPPTPTLSPAEKVRASRERTKLAETSVGSIPGTPATKPTFSREDLMNMTEAEMEKLDRESPNWADFVQP